MKPYHLSLTLLFAGLLLTAIHCTPSQNVQEDPPPKEEVSNTIPGKIIVLLKPRVQPTPLLQEFSSFALKNEGRTSRTENRWLFSFNTNLIPAKDMLTKIKASDQVLEAVLAPIKTGS